MLHPIFSTLVTRPDLIVDHLSGYTALLGEETKSVGTEVVVKIMGWVLMGMLLMLSIGLAGVALMIGALHGFHWALVAVPGGALVLALVAFFIARKPLGGGHYTEFKTQLKTDVATLRAAGGHHGR